MANVIDDQLDGGPQWIENAGHQPVWVETKSQLKRLLDARNLMQIVRTEQTPTPKTDDPRFHPDGWRALTGMDQSPVVTQSGIVGAAETKVISRERMAALAQCWDVLCDPMNGLGYQVVCPRCTRLFGEGRDGVRAENSTVAGHLKIECGCTTHVYVGR